MVAGFTGSDQVGPGGFSSKMLRQHMVNSQFTGIFTAVLALELVAAKNLLFGEFYTGAGPLDNLMKANDRGFGIGSGHSANYTTAIHDHVGFPNNN